MNRQKKSRRIDLILLLITTIATGIFVFFLYNLNVLPFRLRIAGISILMILYLLAFLLYFKRLKQKKLWVYRTFMVLLTAVVLTGSFYIYKASDSLKQVTSNRDGYITISVITKKNSALNSEKDLKNKKVGMQSGHDQENADYGKTELNKLVNNVSYETSEDYVTLSDQLESEEFDALIIPTSSINNLNTIKEGYSDTIKTLVSFQRKIDTSKSSSNTKDLTKEPFTILLSGIDSADSGIQSTLSDVNMILIVNPQSNHIEMVSFPRDAYVPNVALGKELDKLTHLGNNGTQNIMDSLGEIVGFDLDFYIQVNFTSVLKIVDALGGIVVDVPITVSEQDSNRKAQMVQLTEGPQQTLNGEQALALARHRASYGDVERTKVQQSVLRAIITKISSKDGALAASELLDIVGKNIKTDISESQINDFVSYELDNLTPWTLGNTTLEHGYSDSMTTASMPYTCASCYILNFDDIERLYQTYYMVFNPIKFSKFKFDLNDTYKDLPKLKRSTYGFFTDDVYKPPVNNDYDYNYEDEYVPENNYVPPINNENNYIPETEIENKEPDPVEEIPPVNDGDDKNGS